MKMTTLHINAVLGMIILSILAGVLAFLLVRNDLSEAQFTAIYHLLAGDILGIVTVVKHFAGITAGQDGAPAAPKHHRRLWEDE